MKFVPIPKDTIEILLHMQFCTLFITQYYVISIYSSHKISPLSITSAARLMQALHAVRLQGWPQSTCKCPRDRIALWLEPPYGTIWCSFQSVLPEEFLFQSDHNAAGTCKAVLCDAFMDTCRSGLTFLFVRARRPSVHKTHKRMTTSCLAHQRAFFLHSKMFYLKSFNTSAKLFKSIWFCFL